MDSLPCPYALAIPLPSGHTAYVDYEDADLAQQRWHFSGGYTRRTIGHHDGVVHLHRVILERKLERPIESGMVCDHINGDTLDNRRSNLREATPRQNQHNKRHQVTNSHGYKGVINDRTNKTFVARIRVDGKRLCLGRYATAEAAARAYDQAAIRYFGEFARINFPHEYSP